ncbi:tRNA (adenosine(37)-N6)-dimethylallyltransferase MiaA [bacterium]|nr:tRNA (adenosine(37)-N6)-dimethylallyltransferase MiaA [bacterium]
MALLEAQARCADGSGHLARGVPPLQDAPSPIVGYLAGPTASGKSALAVELALRHGWAIISADSMQVYRGMEIGTGAIAPSEQRGVPHHLLGVADPRETFHAARFVTEARAAAAMEWESRGRRSLVCGGTGLWIEALREGLFEGPGRDESLREELRARIAAEGPEALHAELALVDPAIAATIRPRDAVRIIRALEVFRLTGRPLSEWYAEDQARRAALGPLPPLVVLDWPREELDRRINARVDQMMAAGWPEEARALDALALPEHSPARKALGYPELAAVARGERALPEVVEAIKLATRQYARSQMTWFRRRRDAVLVAAGYGVEERVEQQLLKST